jgi:hypothetical protein
LNTVRENLLNGAYYTVELNWFLLDDRQKMVVWMQGYMPDVIKKMKNWKVIEQAKQRMNEYEETKRLYERKLRKIIKMPFIKKIVASGDKKELSMIIRGIYPTPYCYALFKYFDSGELDDGLLREVTFRMEYHQKSWTLLSKGGKEDE